MTKVAETSVLFALASKLAFSEPLLQKITSVMLRLGRFEVEARVLGQVVELRKDRFKLLRIQ